MLSRIFTPSSEVVTVEVSSYSLPSSPIMQMVLRGDLSYEDGIDNALDLLITY